MSFAPIASLSTATDGTRERDASERVCFRLSARCSLSLSFRERPPASTETKRTIPDRYSLPVRILAPPPRAGSRQVQRSARAARLPRRRGGDAQDRRG
eukprot:29888-Pelagococcus_subviridis.AAC.3